MPVSSLVSCVLLDFLEVVNLCQRRICKCSDNFQVEHLSCAHEIAYRFMKQYQETKTMVLVKQKILFDCGTKVLNDQNQASACRKTECALPQKQLHSSHVLMCWRSLGWTNGVVHTIGYTLQY